jgi:predicted pyridoxine 5'-phosphate oxidase superfamily flavin-nucleotide-binding protein
MAKNYASLAFTDRVKSLQRKYGSRPTYELVEKRSTATGLTDAEEEFISNRDSFYMATIGENGFPYIQHRGGPKGFVTVINPTTIAFIDFSGNKQYITVGNLATQSKVALIMMDYPAQTRLKIYAQAEIIEFNARPDLWRSLSLENYKARPERIILLHIEAYDWNCPQHITPRYTEAEIEEALIPMRERIASLEKELSRLKEPT